MKAKMINKILSIILCVILIFCIGGCWDKREPKRLAVVLSIIYDLNEDGHYKVVVEYLNPTAKTVGGNVAGNSEGSSPSVTKTSVGKTMPEAVRQVSESIERKVFGGHNSVRFFSERFAKRDIVTAMDFFLRDYITDEHSYIVIIKGDKPEEVYNPKIALSESTGKFIETMETVQPYVTSKGVFVSTLDFVKDLFKEGKQPVAGLIELKECKDRLTGDMQAQDGQAQNQIGIIYEGLAAFKENKLVGYFDGEEARAYNILVNKFKTTFMSVDTQNHRTSIRVTKVKSKIKPAIDGSKYKFDVKVTANIEVIQEEGKLHTNEYPGLVMLQQSFDQQLKEEIEKAIKKAQEEFKSDIFGFGNVLYKTKPKKWREIKDNWNDIFTTAEINVTVNSSVTRGGRIHRPIKKEVKY